MISKNIIYFCNTMILILIISVGILGVTYNDTEYKVMEILNKKENKMTEKLCVICDIDNVYSDSREWIKHLPSVSKAKDRKAWDEYQTKHYLVKPNKKIIDKISHISKYVPIIFITAREDRNDVRKNTLREIESFSGDTIKIGILHKLYMREEGDYRSSDVVKEEILIREVLNKGFKPIVAVDDEEANIEMFKRHGIPTKLYDISK